MQLGVKDLRSMQTHVGSELPKVCLPSLSGITVKDAPPSAADKQLSAKMPYFLKNFISTVFPLVVICEIVMEKY